MSPNGSRFVIEPCPLPGPTPSPFGSTFFLATSRTLDGVMFMTVGNVETCTKYQKRINRTLLTERFRALTCENFVVTRNAQNISLNSKLRRSISTSKDGQNPSIRQHRGQLAWLWCYGNQRFHGDELKPGASRAGSSEGHRARMYILGYSCEFARSVTEEIYRKRANMSGWRLSTKQESTKSFLVISSESTVFGIRFSVSIEYVSWKHHVTETCS